MQMHGQMARVPVTARQKFSEAAYFYNGMLPHRTNPVVFPYYLSAFVSALRSVTYYLQKQYAHDKRFTAWYAYRYRPVWRDAPIGGCRYSFDRAFHRLSLSARRLRSEAIQLDV